ncbi:MAG TPA: hypothetical protein VLW44_04985 [Streptosporangiaceae bacterium]|nr:hypothetical protein [Streptosporangiaceae bacterium]
MATARADLSVIKARQQRTWASGDPAVLASRIVLASELLPDAADLKAGWTCWMSRAATATPPWRQPAPAPTPGDPGCDGAPRQ